MIGLALMSLYDILTKDDLFSNDLYESQFIVIYALGALHFLWVDAIYHWKISRAILGLSPPQQSVLTEDIAP